MKYSTAIVFLILPLLTSSYYMKIGILSHDLGEETTKKIWSMAQNFSTMMSLEPIVLERQWQEHDSAADISRSICNLANRGIDALVFLGPSLGNSFISSYSTHLGLPFISAAEHGVSIGKYQVSMLPDTTNAAADFIVHHNWDRFIFFYDSPDGPDQLQKILQYLISKEFVHQVDGFFKTLDVKTAVRCIGELLSPDINRRIVLATSEEFADSLSSELASINIFSILLLTPVGTVESPPIQGRYMHSLIKFSVVDAKDPVLVALENRLKTLPSFYARGRRTSKNVPDSVILHYDSSSLLNTMFNKIALETPGALMSRTNLDCLEFSGHIPETSNVLRQTYVEHGVTGRIQFDQDGRRIVYEVDIIESSPHAVQKIGNWSANSGLQFLPNLRRNPPTPTYEAQRSDPPVKVLGIITEPFLFRSANGTLQGYFVDLLNELTKEIKITFDLQADPDGIYGLLVNGQWIGIVGKLERGEIEVAVAPLTKTLERQQVIDFSKTIITTGLNILMKKKESDSDNSTFESFAFLTVWSVETWMVILIVVAIFSASGYAISRFIGAPDRVRALETKGTDSLSPCGSIWLTVGSLFCRDTGIYPRNLTHRLWALLWWIFCIFITLLYVSMLTSSLIKARTTTTDIHSRKTSQDLLKEFLDTGFPVVGTVRGGSTMAFFTNSELGIYQQFGQYLKDHPEVMTNSYAEGVEKVRKSGGKFAYIMESASSELIANQEPCDTLVTSGFLATRPYGIALRKNSSMKEIIDHGVLTLMETGRLRMLYEKWWHNELTSCEDRSLNILPKVYNTSMTLHEVSGIFYLFIMFSLLSVAIATAEYYIRTRNIAVL